MSMDVSIRLRLDNDLSRDAKVATKDLHAIEEAAKKLGRVGGSDKLGKDLAGVRREAGKGEKAVSDLERQARKLNTVKTDAAEREIKALGTAGRATQKDLAGIERKMRNIGQTDAGKLERLNKPASLLGSTMGMLGSNAAGAFAGLVAFASVDNILRGLENLGAQFRALDRDVASVAVTAEMRTPEAMAKISKSNEKLSIRYGTNQTAVNAARKSYAAAGFGIEQQEEILDPTLKAAKAEDSDGATMSQAVIALQQNLGVKNNEVPTVLDMMAKGSKLGSFEVDAMAKNFPSMTTLYGRTGRKGTQGSAELIALAQIARMGAGSQDEAATNLQNMFSKLFSEDSVKNFKDKGVDLNKLRNKAEANDTSYTTAVINEVMRLTGGDQLKVNQLFSDQQAGLALAPLLANMEKYNEFLRQIIEDSAGTIDADYNFLKGTPQERADRRGAALQATGDKVGELYGSVTDPVKERFARAVNPDYAAQEGGAEERKRLGSVDIAELRNFIAEQQKRLSLIPTPKTGDIDLLSSSRSALALNIQQLIEELKAAESVQTPPASNDGGDLGKSTGKIPIPIPRPVERQLGTDLSGAADKAMNGYNDRLTEQGDRAVSIAAEKAAEMQRVLNFTATPTIQPSFLPPSASPPSAASGKQSALPTSGNTKLTQNIYSPNSKLAAARAQREQNRAIRMAQARALSGTGAKLA